MVREVIEKYVDIVENEEKVNVRIPKRYVWHAANSLEYYHKREFKQCYRLTKEIVVDVILRLIKLSLRKLNNRGLPFPCIIKLMNC